MDKVPVMISTKDLDYISDMMNWNSLMCKKANHYLKEIEDEQVKIEVQRLVQMHYEHASKLVNLLG